MPRRTGYYIVVADPHDQLFRMPVTGYVFKIGSLRFGVTGDHRNGWLVSEMMTGLVVNNKIPMGYKTIQSAQGATRNFVKKHRKNILTICECAMKVTELPNMDTVFGIPYREYIRVMRNEPNGKSEVV